MKLALILLAALGWWGSHAAELDTNSFRVGFSSTLFSDVNENDAKAAVKVWGQTIAKERGVPTDPEPRIFHDTPELLQALRNKQVDAFGISLVEYAAANGQMNFDHLFVTYGTGHNREQYLLLVRRDSKLEQVSDLRGRSLIFRQASRDCLAQPWLDTVLIQAGARPSVEWLGKLTRSPKLSQLVLPVFFRQSDACVVTRAGYETMCELNPQLGQQLKAIATSSEMVPIVLCFRADYAPAFKEQLFAGLRDLHKTAAGLQVLTIFQTDKIAEEPAACLDSALKLLARHAQIADAARTTNSLPPNGTPQISGGGKL